MENVTYSALAEETRTYRLLFYHEFPKSKAKFWTPFMLDLYYTLAELWNTSFSNSV